MLQEFDFTVGGKTYQVCYTARARFLFEKEAGYPLHQLLAFAGKVSDVEQTLLILAGLEGARARSKSRQRPWTQEEVLDSVLGSLEASERLEVVRVCSQALNAALTLTPAQEVAAGPEGKAPAEA